MTSFITRRKRATKNSEAGRSVSLGLVSLTLTAALFFASCAQPEKAATTNSNAPVAAAPANDSAPAKTQPPANGTAPSNSSGALPTVALPAAIFDIPLKTIDGKSLKLGDYKGKVVVINYWASWCGPCRVETPELVQMSKEYKSRGVEFIGLTTKQNDPDLAPIEEFVREQRVTYPTVYDDGSFTTPLTQAVRARPVIPQSFVLTRDGAIYKHFSGFNADQTPPLLRQAIEMAANEKGSAD